MSFFDAGALLWVKVEGYPWWPCQVLSAEQVGENPIPEGLSNPLPILFLGSNELGFVDGTDTNNVTGLDLNDTEKCEGCASDPTLVLALEAAKASLGAAAESSSDDEDGMNDDELLMGGGDAADATAVEGETEEERRIRRKKEKKEKKSKKDKKDKKKDKSDKKKDKKHRRDEEDEEARPKKSKDASAAKDSSRREEKRHRSEKKSKFVDRIGEDDDDFVAEESSASIRFPKIDVSDDILFQIKAGLEAALEAKDFYGIRDSLSDLSKINVSFDQLLSTGIGQAVGQVCDLSQFKDVNESFGPLQTWAVSIIRFWFDQIPDRHKTQLVDAGEVDRASLASNEDAMSQHSEDEFAQLDTLGMEIERAFPNEEVMAAGGQSAAEVALEIQLAIEALGLDNKASRGAQVITALHKANHGELRSHLLRGELSAKDFVSDPIHYGMSTVEKEAMEAAEVANEKAHDITGEKERIEHAIAVAEVVEK